MLTEGGHTTEMLMSQRTKRELKQVRRRHSYQLRNYATPPFYADFT